VTVIIIIIIIIIKHTSTKPQAGKLGQTYKIMVATANYSVTMVLRIETAFFLFAEPWKGTFNTPGSIDPRS